MTKSSESRLSRRELKKAEKALKRAAANLEKAKKKLAGGK